MTEIARAIIDIKIDSLINNAFNNNPSTNIKDMK